VIVNEFHSTLRPNRLWHPIATALILGAAAALGALAQVPPKIASIHQAFAHPPDDCRIMMRWWWFGPSQTREEIKRELEQMKAAGIGGVEIATLYPLAVDNPATGFHNYPFTSNEHLEMLRFAAGEARRLGLRVDITLGSGWPFGGPSIPVTQAAGQLRVAIVSAPAGADSVAKPSLETGESIAAVFVTPGSDKSSMHLNEARALLHPDGDRVEISQSKADQQVLFFISSRTGMAVKRAADGAAGFVLDHYDRAAIENYLHAVGDRLLSAFREHPPYAVFSDSLEDYGSDWTPDLLAEFQRRRGYDLTPHLPAVIGDDGPETAAIRHDWGRTLTELANERYLEPIHAWAQQHHTLFRSQTYGFPPVTLSSNRYADLPEGEGKARIQMAREFSDTRWAASAGHLFGHNVISSETWTWLHSPAFQATPLDMKAEADLHFLQGINQLVGHGWPYSPPEAGEPGWRMYAAGAFNAHNPWFPVLPDVTAYLQRVSYAMRLGKPANDVAMLLPNDDVWASFKARIDKNRPATSIGGFDESGSNVTIDESMPKFLGKEVIAQILDAGFNVDFIDADAIDTVGIPYKVLLLPGIDRITPEAFEKILAFAQRGGTVIATRRLPATSPGFLEAARDSARVQELSTKLFHGSISTAHFVPDEHRLGTELATWIKPDVTFAPRTASIGFIHRHLDNGDLYFLANTSNEPVSVRANFRSAGANAELWDPFTGSTDGIETGHDISFDFAPYESRLVFFSDQALSPKKETATTTTSTTLDGGWNLAYSGSAARPLSSFGSWSDDEAHRFYSGSTTYTRTIDLSAEAAASARSIVLDFGPGTPVRIPDNLPEDQANMRAYLDSPVREAAEVHVNGKLAGHVWHAPFRIDLMPYIHSGKNELSIVVFNTAINELAGETPPTYRLLRAKYGVEFIPQGMDHLEPLPCGMTAAPRLLIQH
jgi:hypothetical protein